MKHFVLIALFTFAHSHAQAATINTNIDVTTKVGNNPAVVEGTSGDTGPLPLIGNNARSFVAEHVDTFGPGRGNATAAYDIDQETGTIKFGTSANVTAPSSPIASRSSANLQIGVSEIFSIQGTGDITFRLAIGGILGSTSLAGGTGTRFDASFRLVDQLGLFGFETIGSDRTFANPPRGTTAIFDDVLEFTTTITKSQDYLFQMFFNATAATEARGLGNSNNAEANFLNTAFLSFEADDNLTVSTADPLFLSRANGPDAPPVVPLPAGLVLLLSGLGALRYLKRQ